MSVADGVTIRFLLLSLLLAGGSFVIGIQTAEAANRYWVGSAGGNTDDTANWASADPASCTGGGASVPGSSDIAIFDANDRGSGVLPLLLC